MRLKISIALFLCVVITGFSQIQRKTKIIKEEIIECETAGEENFETDFIPADKKKSPAETVQKIAVLGGFTAGEKDGESTGVSFYHDLTKEDKVIFYVQVKALANCEITTGYVWRWGNGGSTWWTSASHKLKKCTTYRLSVWIAAEDMKEGLCQVTVTINTKKPSSGSGARASYCILVDN